MPRLSLPGSYSFRSAAVRASRSLLNPLLGRLTSNAGYDLRETILVVGWARSGTTWLAEVLSAIPNSAILFEPFHTERVPEAAAAGFPMLDMVSVGAGT